MNDFIYFQIARDPPSDRATLMFALHLLSEMFIKLKSEKCIFDFKTSVGKI